MITIGLQVLLILLNVANVFLHTIGTCLLLSIYRNGVDTPQQVYLINLSTCEAIMNLLEFIRRVPNLFSIPEHIDDTVKVVQEYILIIMFTGISLVYYLDMIYVTTDRLLDILLSLKYPVFWNKSKAIWLIIWTWLLGILLSVSILLLHMLTSYGWEEAFFKYFFPILEFIFIINAIVTYSFIFKMYIASRSLPAKLSGASEIGRTRGTLRLKNTFRIFRKSRFYIPVLLITTFFLFMIIPDLTYLFVAIIYESPSDTLSICCWISYATSNIVDAWIYIYLQVPVRRLLKRKLSCLLFVNFRRSVQQNSVRPLTI